MVCVYACMKVILRLSANYNLLIVLLKLAFLFYSCISWVNDIYLLFEVSIWTVILSCCLISIMQSLWSIQIFFVMPGRWFDCWSSQLGVDGRGQLYIGFYLMLITLCWRNYNNNFQSRKIMLYPSLMLFL
jgi:hypothetical protein